MNVNASLSHLTRRKILLAGLGLVCLSLIAFPSEIQKSAVEKRMIEIILDA